MDNINEISIIDPIGSIKHNLNDATINDLIIRCCSKTNEIRIVKSKESLTDVQQQASYGIIIKFAHRYLSSTLSTKEKSYFVIIDSTRAAFQFHGKLSLTAIKTILSTYSDYLADYFKYEPTIMTFDSAGKREIRPEAYNWDRFKKE